MNLVNDEATSSDTVIRFTWEDGAANGGTPILDYSVFYDQGIDSVVLLQANVLDKYYQTTVSLTPGLTYKFTVTARNSVGHSADSAVLAVLAATLPEAPINLANNAVLTTAY